MKGRSNIAGLDIATNAVLYWAFWFCSAGFCNDSQELAKLQKTLKSGAGADISFQRSGRLLSMSDSTVVLMAEMNDN